MTFRFEPLMLAMLILCAPARAAVSVDHFRFEHPDARVGGAEVRWRTLDARKIDLSFSACPVCRNPDPKRYRFTIDAPTAQRIDALLPDSLIEAATRAPCTLPTAEAGWAQRVGIVRSDEKGNTTQRQFFIDCESPELVDLRKRITLAAELLLGEAKRQGVPPEPGW